MTVPSHEYVTAYLAQLLLQEFKLFLYFLVINISATKILSPSIVYLGVIPRGNLRKQEYKYFHETIQNAL